MNQNQWKIYFTRFWIRVLTLCLCLVLLKLPQNYKICMTVLGNDPTPTFCLWGLVLCTPGLEPILNSVISHRGSLHPRGLSEVQAIRELCPLSDDLEEKVF